MEKIPLVEPPVERKYVWLRWIVLVAGALTLAGSVLASYIALQRDLLLGLATIFIGLLALCLIVVLAEAIRVWLDIEENTRQANTMAQYTMQTTHNLTAIHNAMEEMALNIQASTDQIFTVTKEMHGIVKKVDDLAIYSRTTAILLHQQSQQYATSAEYVQETNGVHASNGNGNGHEPQAQPDAQPVEQTITQPVEPEQHKQAEQPASSPSLEPQAEEPLARQVGEELAPMVVAHVEEEEAGAEEQPAQENDPQEPDHGTRSGRVGLKRLSISKSYH